MGRLGRRLAVLERRLSARRCATCRTWPDTRVVHTDPTMAALVEGWAERRGQPAESTPPERCTTCGWEPFVILVEYAEDWGSA